METENEKEVKKWGYVIVEKGIGGIGDRIRSIALAYHLAKFTNRTIIINGEQVIGANYRELFDSDELNTKYTKLPDDQRWDFYNLDIPSVTISSMDFNTISHKEQWTITTNCLLLRFLLENKSLQSSNYFKEFVSLYDQGLLFQSVIRAVFKPTPHLQNLIKDIFSDEGFIRDQVYLIGIHLRHGDHAEIIDPPQNRKRDNLPIAHLNPELVNTREVPIEYSICYIRKAISIWREMDTQEKKKFPGGVVFFVSSDHKSSITKIINFVESTTLDEAGSKVHVFDTEKKVGRIKHIDKTSGDQTRTYVDWLILSQSNVGIFSQSGFSETAAKFNCIPCYLFHFVRERNAKLTDITTINDPFGDSSEIDRICDSHFLDFTKEHPPNQPLVSTKGFCNVITDSTTIQPLLTTFFI